MRRSPRPSPRPLSRGLALLVLACASPLPALDGDGGPSRPRVEATAPAVPQEDTLPSGGEADTVPGTEADTVPAAVPEELLPSDERIEEELNAIFDRIPGLEEVEARVEAGVVVLTGRTNSLEARSRAAELAEAMEGTVHVANRIEQRASLDFRVQAVLRSTRDRLLAFAAYLPLVAAAVALVGAFWLLAFWAGRWARLYGRLAPRPFARNVLRAGIQSIILLTGVVLALQLLEITALVGAVLGAAGIVGLALGFAFRPVAESYLAGLVLALRQPFDPNDHVVLGTHEGKVIRLKAAETILMTLEGNHLRIPNATVFGSTILNYTRNPLRRFEFPVSVGDGEEPGEAMAEGVAALEAMPGVLEEPSPFARVEELGDGVVHLRFFGWVDQRQVDIAKVRSEAIRLVKARLEAAEISMPPTAYLVQTSGAPAEEEPPPRRERETKRWPVPAPEVEVQDLSVDTVLDAQIAEDRRTSEEEDFLEPRENEEEPAG